MKHIGKITLLTATLLALSTHAVAAETTQPQTTAEATTVEVTTVQPTTQELPTTSEATPPTDDKSIGDVQKEVEKPNQTGLVEAEGETYYYVDGKPITSTWKWVNGRWYYFGKDGKMLFSTITPDGYLLDNEGLLASPGWNYLNGKRYYTDSGGKIFRNDWKKIDGKWYSFKDNGVLRQNEFYDYYYLKADGAMADNEWVFDRYYNSYFFMKPGGAYASREWKDSYYLKAGGYMAKSEFVYDDNYKATYYFEESGQYVGGKWIEVNGKKYHFQKDGVLETNKWIGNYYVKSDGAMAKNEWFFDKNYGSYFYLGVDGKYIGGNRWYQVDGDWYYFIADGQMATRKWIGPYYVKEDGRMAINEWIYDKNYGGYFYLKEDGVYVTNQFTIDGKKHLFQADGLWIAEVPKAVNYGEYKNVIFLDPGHGGKDPGAVYNGLREKDLNMQIYHKLRRELEKLGYTVLTSRDKDEFVDYVTERSQMVNKTDADFFISIHFNSTGVPGANRSGVETYIYEADEDYPPKINKDAHDNPLRMRESKRLAENLHASIIKMSGANDGGINGASFAVLRETTKPAVLLELGYIDNPEESKKISDSAYQDKLVAGIVSGIQNFYKTTK